MPQCGREVFFSIRWACIFYPPSWKSITLFQKYWCPLPLASHLIILCKSTMCLPKMKRSLRNKILLLFLLAFTQGIFSQNTIVHGVITDAKTKERLPFATVFFDESNAGTTTNEKGEYPLETDKG